MDKIQGTNNIQRTEAEKTMRRKALIPLAVEANKYNQLQEQVFCPVIRDMCRPDCASFNKSYIVEPNKSDPYVQRAYCSNPNIDLDWNMEKLTDAIRSGIINSR